MVKRNEYTIYPTIPLRDIVIFPHMIVSLLVGRSKSIKAIEELTNKSKEVLLVAQRDVNIDTPTEKELYKVGTLAKVTQAIKLQDGSYKMIVEATAKVKIIKMIDNDGYFQSLVQPIADQVYDDIEMKALMKSAVSQFQEYGKNNNKINQELFAVIDDIKDADHLSSLIIANLGIVTEKKQLLLEMTDSKELFNKLLLELEYEISLLKSESKIRDNVRKQIDKTQKDFYLHEQLKAIHKELGNKEQPDTEAAQLEKKINETKLSDEAKERALTELGKLKNAHAATGEATMIRNYLDHLLGLPWGQYTEIKQDIAEADKVLNRDHYGLDKVKDRILEFLSVQKRTDSLKGPIMCLVGPPGVGKTSLAKSVAEATGRKFVRFALGGIRDEAEIRGHRKTYLGAMPGKIMYLLKKAKSSNPVILLDEIDKLSYDYRGDPSSALLEVLDPEQNNKFMDSYLEVEYDLSKVLFIATANSTNMPSALMDRMEMVRIEGYTEDEKLSIAQNYLMKKQFEDHKLTSDELVIPDDVVRHIIRYYTKEAGVRNLEKEIAKIARKRVREIETKKPFETTITLETVSKYLGVKKTSFGEKEETNLVGVTTGLAYTEFGGDLLSIEALTIPGGGSITSTGKLGKVMSESSQAAFSYFKSNAHRYGVTVKAFRKNDVHLHVPEGAVPKDGPSAGVAIFTSIVSVMTGIPVRSDVAMTGEITLRGRVLPIGGLKEKLLAALRGGIKHVLIPHENLKDLAEIPENVTSGLMITPIMFADEALKYALIDTPQPIKEPESIQISTVSLQKAPESIVAH